jgi:hypothetical protein
VLGRRRRPEREHRQRVHREGEGHHPEAVHRQDRHPAGSGEGSGGWEEVAVQNKIDRPDVQRSGILVTALGCVNFSKKIV